MTDARRIPIVVGVDLSEYADAVLQHAFSQARRHEQPEVHVIAVVPEGERRWRRPSESTLRRAEEQARARLVERVRASLDEVVPAEQRGAWAVHLHVRRGRPEEQVTLLAAEVLAELLVVGRFGHAARGRRGLGSTADRIVQLADCPVLVVTPARDTSASDRQCPECVEVRARSGGEAWFCARHHTDRIGHSVLLSPTYGAGPHSSGTTMW
jgi:nucleotide-binding universal stress UspA family protein